MISILELVLHRWTCLIFQLQDLVEEETQLQDDLLHWLTRAIEEQFDIENLHSIYIWIKQAIRFETRTLKWKWNLKQINQTKKKSEKKRRKVKKKEEKWKRKKKSDKERAPDLRVVVLPLGNELRNARQQRENVFVLRHNQPPRIARAHRQRRHQLGAALFARRRRAPHLGMRRAAAARTRGGRVRRKRRHAARTDVRCGVRAFAIARQQAVASHKTQVVVSVCFAEMRWLVTVDFTQRVPFATLV